jgi:hypothetical protein
MSTWICRIGFVLAFASTLQAQAPPSIPGKLVIGGDGPMPVTLTLDDLAKMPRASVAWSERGPKVNYQGVLLYEVLKRAGAPLDKQLSGKALASYVLAEASDGYQVTFTLAEIDPGFTDNQILVADTADGQPLSGPQGPLRLVLANEKQGARAVRMLERLTVVRLRK